MPKFLPPDQVEALREKGVVFPPEAPVIPSETVARALGDIGLPHSEKVERLEVESISIPEFAGNIEGLDNQSLKNSYLNAQDKAYWTMDLIGLGEQVPSVYKDPDVMVQLNKLKPAFEVFQRSGLDPEVVFTPIHRSVDFWENLVQKAQDSAFNPNSGVPGHSSRLLSEGGLFIASPIREEWDKLTNPSTKVPSWQLSITSGLSVPAMPGLNSYGYTTRDSVLPGVELNPLLKSIGLPSVNVRSRMLNPGYPQSPLVQPDIHPSPDTYIMQQLCRLVQGKTLLDFDDTSVTCSHLKGMLSSGETFYGRFGPVEGQIRLITTDAKTTYKYLGIRPSVRADHA